jgi:hypothetical protein
MEDSRMPRATEDLIRRMLGHADLAEQIEAFFEAEPERREVIVERLGVAYRYASEKGLSSDEAGKLLGLSGRGFRAMMSSIRRFGPVIGLDLLRRRPKAPSVERDGLVGPAEEALTALLKRNPEARFVEAFAVVSNALTKAKLPKISEDTVRRRLRVLRGPPRERDLRIGSKLLLLQYPAVVEAEGFNVEFTAWSAVLLDLGARLVLGVSERQPFSKAATVAIEDAIGRLRDWGDRKRPIATRPDAVGWNHVYGLENDQVRWERNLDALPEGRPAKPFVEDEGLLDGAFGPADPLELMSGSRVVSPLLGKTRLAADAELWNEKVLASGRYRARRSVDQGEQLGEFLRAIFLSKPDAASTSV